MRLAIIGNVQNRRSESLDDCARRVVPLIEKTVDEHWLSPCAIVTGRKTVVDRAAFLFAKMRGLPVHVFGFQFNILANADALPAIGEGMDEPVARMHRAGIMVYVAADESQLEGRRH